MSRFLLSCLLELTVFFLLWSVVCATDVFVNDNDSALSYSGSWQEGRGCGSCALQPDACQTFDGTWHDTTYHAGSVASTITLKFTGVGVSAIFVVPDTTQGDATVDTNLVFTLDGSQAGTYTHSPSGGAGFLYNQTLFAKCGLNNDDHTLVVSAAAPDGQSSAVLFDYFIYTTDNGTSSSGAACTTSTSSSFSSTAVGGSSSSSGASNSSGTSSGSPNSSTAESSSSSSSTGTGAVSPTKVSADGNRASVPDVYASLSSHTNVDAIAGGVVGGVLVLLLSLLLLFCYRRRKRAREYADDNVSSPTTTTTTMGWAAERTRSWFVSRLREDDKVTPYPMIYSEKGRSVARPDLDS